MVSVVCQGAVYLPGGRRGGIHTAQHWSGTDLGLVRHQLYCWLGVCFLGYKNQYLPVQKHSRFSSSRYDLQYLWELLAAGESCFPWITLCYLLMKGTLEFVLVMGSLTRTYTHPKLTNLTHRESDHIFHSEEYGVEQPNGKQWYPAGWDPHPATHPSGCLNRPGHQLSEY